jgi:hypothetical protein
MRRHHLLERHRAWRPSRKLLPGNASPAETRWIARHFYRLLPNADRYARNVCPWEPDKNLFEEIQSALSLAEDIGLKPTGDLDLECEEKPIRWDALG